MIKYLDLVYEGCQNFYMNWLGRLIRRQNSSTRKNQLEFDGLNPLLARQLSEMEGQLGQLVQIQFELSQEREKMRNEMNQLRQSILKDVETGLNKPELLPELAVDQNKSNP